MARGSGTKEQVKCKINFCTGFFNAEGSVFSCELSGTGEGV